MIALCGEQVVLRTLEREDCRSLWQAYEPVQPIPTEPLRPGLSVEGADAWFDDIQGRQGQEQLYLGIFTLEDRLVGDIQLAQIDWRQRTAQIGVGIARQADRGRGYGTDAVRALLRFAFEHLDLARVGISTSECNSAAQRLIARCGFQYEGRERQAIYCAGRRWDRLLYGMLRSERPEQSGDRSYLLEKSP